MIMVAESAEEDRKVERVATHVSQLKCRQMAEVQGILPRYRTASFILKCMEGVDAGDHAIAVGPLDLDFDGCRGGDARGLRPQPRDSGGVEDRGGQAQQHDYPLPFFKKHCSYLFFTGVQQVWTRSVSTRKKLRRVPALR